MNQLDRARQRLSRVHDELFPGEQQQAEFFNHTGGSWNPEADEITAESRTSIGTITVEIVPPAIDSTVQIDGTSFSWDTSIRFPIVAETLTVKSGKTHTVPADTTEQYSTVIIESDATLTVNGSLLVYDSITNNGTVDDNGTITILGNDDFGSSLIPLGEDGKRPTEIEIVDNIANETEVYQLYGFTEERGSGFIMCRIVEK